MVAEEALKVVSVRAAKSKGSQFEYDCQASLEQLPFTDSVTRTAERGYQRQYDLHMVQGSVVTAIECKRLKGMSWNQAKKYWQKLKEKAPEASNHYLLFKSNRQPCLVMYEDTNFNNQKCLKVCEFEDWCGFPFIKHKSTRA